MHEQDQMTPNERLQAFMKGEEMDRILAMPILVSISHRVSGITHREKRASAEKQAQSQIDCYKRFGMYNQDQLIGLEKGDTFESLYGVAVDIGTTTVVASLIDLGRGKKLRVKQPLMPRKTLVRMCSRASLMS